MPTQKSRAEYMAARRAALKAARIEDAPQEQELAKEGEKIQVGHPDMIGGHEEPRTKDRRPKRLTDEEKVRPDDIMTDRERGLPRSNYYGDWVPTIRKMSGQAIQKILDHPAIKTAKRG